MITCLSLKSTKTTKMKQVYHFNSKTNIHFRSEICNSNLSNVALAELHKVSVNTISKWKNRETFEDKSSRPLRIDYSLNAIEKAVVIATRKATWLSLNEILEMVYPDNPKKMRSAVYRTFVLEKINTKPQAERDKAKKFKEYEPGYIHLDVTYLPKINGVKYYLFVAIDRATRFLHYKIYDAKTAKNTVDFMEEFKELFPVKNITHILTDNGLEFTNKLIVSKKGEVCQKDSLLDIFCEENNIQHRLIKPFTPQTNGMVERANGTIKQNTIKRNNYENLEEMNNDLLNFLKTYNLHRLHGGLRRELNVKTPIQAIEKWYELKPEIFKDNPDIFLNKIINLKSIKQA
jgi:transposase InsO family protein